LAFALICVTTETAEYCGTMTKFRFIWFGLALLLGQATVRAAGPLTADEVVQNAVARGQQDQQGTVPNFSYRKQTVVDQLDNAGNVKEHREKVYDVSCRDGRSHATLLEVNGHPPSDADLKQQSDNEMSIRQITGEAKRPNGDNRENFLTAELVARFDFQLVGETNFNGRATHLISFQPKNPELPVHRLVDRLLNQISGTLWIDAGEFEVARADVSLRSEVNLLGGLIGSLKKLDYTLERTRVADGVWFSTLSSGDFLGRKLLDTTHLKTKSQSVHFHRVATTEGTKLAEN
jgi:hypothetical protein